jgi:SAM-dependent methyltransferase
MYWWEQYFGSDDYLLLEGNPAQNLVERCANFICSALNIGDGSRVCDVGCGRGRLALALAKRGCIVTGIDSSAYMIGRCQRLAADEPKFTIQREDFRKMSFKEEFEAVVCWGNTLGYGTREDDVQALGRLVTSLIPGGMILIDLHNLEWYKNNAVGRDWRETDRAFVLSDVAYDDADQKLVCRDIIVPKDGGHPRDYRSTFLEYQPLEIKRILELVGVTKIEFYGDACAFAGGPLFCLEGFNERSHVMIIIGRKEDG